MDALRKGGGGRKDCAHSRDGGLRQQRSRRTIALRSAEQVFSSRGYFDSHVRRPPWRAGSGNQGTEPSDDRRPQTRRDLGFVDQIGARLDGTQKLLCELTVRDGKVVYDLNGLTRERWDKLPPNSRGSGDPRWDGLAPTGGAGGQRPGAKK